MKAGFLSLFTRSLYRGTASRIRELEPESEEGRRVHEERERFAAAAIAFCLEHDRSFLQHFWKKVCGRTGDRKSRVMPTVEVEPRRWSDLLLKSGDVLCAVEIKIGAKLADHQNPTSKMFLDPGGYGHFLKKHCHEHNSHPRYIVLGCDSTLALRKEKIRDLEVGQRGWDDLLSGLRATPLTKDLTALLSSFGIWQFTFKAMKEKTFSGKLGDVGSAVRILESVRDNLAWPDSLKVIADPGGDGTYWGLGFYLPPYWRKKTVRGLAERLQRDNEVPKDSGVAWFGYFATPGEKATRCVYAYCSQTARKRLVERLKSARFNVDDTERDGDSGPYCAVVRAGHEKLGDIEWFTMALEAGAEAR